MHRAVYIGDSMNKLYSHLCSELDKSYDFDVGPRGLKTHEIMNPRIVLTNPRKCIITLTGRNMNMHYFVGELAHYLGGRKDLKSIAYYSKFWNKVSDDDKTINSCYGYRLFKRGRRMSQFSYAFKQLVSDKNTRKAVMHISGPNDAKMHSKDNICTTVLQFIIRDDKLYLFNNMRSNDIWYGLTYDVPFFCLVQQIMLQSLLIVHPNLTLGDYVHETRSLHVYEQHWENMKRMNKDYVNGYLESMPELTNIDILYWFDAFLSYEELYRGECMATAEYRTMRKYTAFENWCVDWLRKGRKK